MEFINGKKVQDAGDGDIIIGDVEPYVIDDERILDEIKWMRDHKEKTSQIHGVKIEILHDWNLKTIRHTLVHVEPVK